MTLAQFSEIFALLAVQLRATDADEATIRGYFLALKDLEPELIAMAAARLAVTSAWFPKTSEWRTEAFRVEGERVEAQRALLRKMHPPLCAACDDTSWEPTLTGVKPCACRALRRLEVLGRRPWPQLPEVRPDSGDQEARVMTLVEPIAKSHAMGGLSTWRRRSRWANEDDHVVGDGR